MPGLAVERLQFRRKHLSHRKKCHLHENEWYSRGGSENAVQCTKRFAISRRNEWMVRECDTIVAYVTHGWGGAAKTLEYARRKNKAVLQYGSSDKEENA